jgi:hypothetical protein
MKALISALLLFTGAPDPVVGRYGMNDGPDVASELVIGADGRFTFAIIAGAADYHARGKWERQGDVVRLTTEPTPVPPSFKAGAVKRTAEEPLLVVVRGPNGQAIAGFDVRVGMADGRVVDGYTQVYSWTVRDGDPSGRPVWIELALGMFGLGPQRFAVDGAKGNVFEFAFTPNDLGVMDFRGEPFRVTPKGLVQSFGEEQAEWLRMGE